MTKEKGASLIHSFEAALFSSKFWHLNNANNILMELANRDDIEFLAIVDNKGKVISSSDEELMGQNILPNQQVNTPSPYLNGEMRKLKLIRNGEQERESVFLVDKHLFMVRPRISFEKNLIIQNKRPQPIKDPNNNFNESQERARKHHMENRSKEQLNYNNRQQFVNNRVNELLQGRIYSMLVAFKPNEIFQAQQMDNAKDTVYTTFFVSLTLLGIFSFFILVAYQRSYSDIQKGKAYILSLMDALPLGIITLDHKQNVLALNPNAQKLTNLTEPESLGKNIFEVIPQLYQVNFAENFKNSTITLPQKNENPLQVEVSTFPVPGEKEDGYGIILQDLREIQNLQEKLHRQERLASIGKLAAGIAHEIRNPLGAVKGLARLFAENSAKDSEEAHLASVMTQEVMRVDKVVSDLLELSKPNTVNIISTNLNHIVEKAKYSVRLQTDKEIAFHEDFSPECENVFLDENRIIQVLQNIYLNSIQALGTKNGLIETSAKMIKNVKLTPESMGALQNDLIETHNIESGQRFHNNILEIIIKDNGHGIKSEQIKNIFTPYYTDKAKGTGLGLVMVQKIVQAHNGTVNVESTENLGTQVSIRIPQ